MFYSQCTCSVRQQLICSRRAGESGRKNRGRRSRGDEQGDNGESIKEGDREECSQTLLSPNRDSSVSVATVEKLTARLLFLFFLPFFFVPLCPGRPLCGPCVCCGADGAVNQQLARYRPAIEGRPTPKSPSSPPSPPLLLSLPRVFSPPTKPFINQPVGSRAAPDTWHTILAGGPDIVGGGQV